MNQRSPFRARYRREIFISVALLAATCATFAGLLKAGFTNYDDDRYVYGNPHVQQSLTAESLRWAFASIENANWHPLTWISLELDHELFGLNPAGYHGTNLLLHACNGVLLFWALRLMTGAIARSALVAAFFALHPLHVESVAWVAERKDVLSGFFWLLTLLAYWRYAILPSGRRYLCVASSLALGLMAKPMVVTLPCVLLLLDYWPLGRWRGSAAVVGQPAGDVVSGPRPPPTSAASLALEKLPLLALSAASCAATVLAQRHAGAVKSIADVPFAARAANACVAYASYLRQTFWPESLAVFYPHPGDSLPWRETVAAGGLLLAISLAVLRAARAQPYLPVGWCWYLRTLVPVIGLVQVGEQAMADRYMYLPMIGLLIAAVWCARRVMLSWRWNGPQRRSRWTSW